MPNFIPTSIFFASSSSLAGPLLIFSPSFLPFSTIRLFFFLFSLSSLLPAFARIVQLSFRFYFLCLECMVGLRSCCCCGGEGGMVGQR